LGNQFVSRRYEQITSEHDHTDGVGGDPVEGIPEELGGKNPISGERHCRYCKHIIYRTATVCPDCARDQRWYLNYFRIDHVGLIIALVMILIAYQQLMEVRQERLAASQALKRADEVEKKATKLTENLGEVQARVKRHEESISLIAERAKQSFAEIEAAQQLSLQAKSQVEEVKGLVKKAETSVDQLRNTVDFSLLLTKVRNDDRQAFDQIMKLAEEKGPFWKTFYDVAVQIAMEVDPFVSARIDPEVPWKRYAADPKLDQMEKLLKIYSSIPSVFKPDFISQIWSQERFPKQRRMDFLYEVIKSDRSLRALHRACALMNEEAKINKNILLAKQYLHWWEANRARYDEGK